MTVKQRAERLRRMANLKGYFKLTDEAQEFLIDTADLLDSRPTKEKKLNDDADGIRSSISKSSTVPDGWQDGN